MTGQALWGRWRAGSCLPLAAPLWLVGAQLLLLLAWLCSQPMRFPKSLPSSDVKQEVGKDGHGVRPRGVGLQSGLAMHGPEPSAESLHWGAVSPPRTAHIAADPRPRHKRGLRCWCLHDAHRGGGHPSCSRAHGLLLNRTDSGCTQTQMQGLFPFHFIPRSWYRSRDGHALCD